MLPVKILCIDREHIISFAAQGWVRLTTNKHAGALEVERSFLYIECGSTYMGLPRWLSGKESACVAGDAGLIPGAGRSPGRGNGNPLQYSCLGNPMDRGLVGYRPEGCKELDTTYRLNNHNSTYMDIHICQSHTIIHLKCYEDQKRQNLYPWLI